MKFYVFQALLFAALLSPQSLFCLDADIFKEMLPLGSTVEVQAKSSDNSNKVAHNQNCQLLAAESQCSREMHAVKTAQRAGYFTADIDTFHKELFKLQKCLATYCAQRL